MAREAAGSKDSTYKQPLPGTQHMNMPAAHYPLDPDLVVIILERVADVIAIYRYGSAGSEFERPDSDLDIAILADHLLTFDERLDLAVRLAKLVGRDVDVVDMRGIPVTLRAQIAAVAARLYAGDLARADEFDSRAFSDYARLNEERRGILDDVRRRGSIYG
jgi:predicted nucleotidyltransferase